MFKSLLMSLVMFGSVSALAQNQVVSSERALVDSVTAKTLALCEQFQVDVQNAEVQDRIQTMFGHLGLNTRVTDCKSLSAVIAFSFEREDLQAWAHMGSEKVAKIKAEYSLLIGQLSKRQFAEDPNFTPLSDLQLFEIVVLKGFYDGVKSHLQTVN